MHPDVHFHHQVCTIRAARATFILVLKKLKLQSLNYFLLSLERISHEEFYDSSNDSLSNQFSGHWLNFRRIVSATPFLFQRETVRKVPIEIPFGPCFRGLRVRVWPFSDPGWAVQNIYYCTHFIGPIVFWILVPNNAKSDSTGVPWNKTFCLSQSFLWAWNSTYKTYSNCSIPRYKTF